MNCYVLYFPNGKRYVGVETKPGSRIGDHRRMATLRPSYKSRPQTVDLAVRKYGWETIQWRYLAANCTPEEGWALERTFIRLFRTQDPEWGYNISEGGDKTALGAKRSPEFVERLRTRGKANGMPWANTPEARAKRAATCRANPRRGQRAWNKGRKGTSKATHTSFKPGMTPWNKGGTHSEESRAKMSARQRGRPASAGSFKKGQTPWNKGLRTALSRPRPGRHANSGSFKPGQKPKHAGTRGVKPATTGSFTADSCPTKHMIALPAGPNGERRWFRPEQLI